MKKHFQLSKESISWKTLGLGIILNANVVIVAILLYHAYIVEACATPFFK